MLSDAQRPALARLLNPDAAPAPALSGPNRPSAANANWQQQLLARGWGYAALDSGSIQPDNGAGLTSAGIITLLNKGQPRKPDDWGTLRAVAWGASRFLDHLETDSAVDAKQVGLEGISRYGKEALVTMAYDSRFAIAYVASSGLGGAGLYRRNFGELLANVAGWGEYHWMAGNFVKYGAPIPFRPTTCPWMATSLSPCAPLARSLSPSAPTPAPSVPTRRATGGPTLPAPSWRSPPPRPSMRSSASKPSSPPVSRPQSKIRHPKSKM